MLDAVRSGIAGMGLRFPKDMECGRLGNALWRWERKPQGPLKYKSASYCNIRFHDC
jgi:hypothetical protein